MIRVPAIKKLVGCSIMHCGIKTNVNPESDFYDKTDPEKTIMSHPLPSGRCRWVT